jgi:hypothetical protein
VRLDARDKNPKQLVAQDKRDSMIARIWRGRLSPAQTAKRMKAAYAKKELASRGARRDEFHD